MFTAEAIEELSAGTGIYQAGNAVKQAISENNAVIALPEKFGVRDLEKYMPNRRRQRGTMKTTSVEDFGRYTVNNIEHGSYVFVDAEQMSATAVLNLGDAEFPGHADNLAELTLKRTAAYSALRKIASGQGFSQAAVAEFFEDWPGFFKFYKDSEQVTPPKAVAAVRRLTIEAMRKLEASEQALATSRSAFESVQATSADPIPTTIYFTCEPYQGLPQREFVLRLSIQTGGNNPVICLRVVKQEEHDEQMAREFADKVSAAIGTEVPVLLGSYQPK